jgi:TRAP transporter TAXI family solute receptor
VPRDPAARTPLINSGAFNPMVARAMRPTFRLLFAAAALLAVPALAQERLTLSIGSGSTGGVYYPLGGGLAQVLSRHVPGWQATAEVTGGSVDNLKLVGTGKADLGFSMVDAAWDAYAGNEKFAGRKLPLRTLMVLYANRMHVVTTDSTGIATMQDLAGKRVSVGSAGSATEIMAVRVLEAYGLADSVRRERLSVNESVNAIKDRKIDAFFWAGGVPTAAVTDLAATPGVKIRLLDHADAVEAMNRRHGPLYSPNVIPKSVYPGMARDATNATVWNVLVANAAMSDEVAYTIVKTVFERKPELVAVHKEFATLSLDYQTNGASALPFHPGAIRYFAEKGLKLQ